MHNLLSALILSVFFLFFPCNLFALDWFAMSQSSIAWDPVKNFENGSQIPAGDLIEYKIYLCRTADVLHVSPVEVCTVPDTFATLNYHEEGRFYVGLQTVRKSHDGTFLAESIIVWSDNPAIVADGQTFGLFNYLCPAPPLGLCPVKLD